MPQVDRQDARLPAQSRVFVELESAAAGSAEEATIAVCQALDVSSYGLRVSLQQEVPVGAYLQIGVEPPSDRDSEPFYLASQVRWCRKGDDPDYPWQAGFSLLEAGHSDISSWVALINSLDSSN